MEKEVLVRVKGLFTISEADPEQDQVEVISPGSFYEKSGKYFVLFDEHMEDFCPPTHNTLKIGGGQISLIKRGMINADMEFIPGKETLCHYTTPYGSIVLGILTDPLRIHEEPGELTVDIHYQLSIDYSHVTDCCISIRILEKAHSAFSLTQ